MSMYKETLAREQGITIQPIGKGASGMVPFVILLDGREIARTMIDNINTGSVGNNQRQGW